jgi:transcriptional regulator with XRE-family HTH domain
MGKLDANLKQKIKELAFSDDFLQKNKKYSAIYENQTEGTTVFGHSLSSYQLSAIQSRLRTAQNTLSLGKYIRKLAADKGRFHYNEAFFGQAQITRQYWSKLLNDKYERPSKEVILRIAILFRCDLKQTHELLAKAGYTFSDCDLRDQIVLSCIELGVYDFADIEELLEDEGLSLF